MGVLAALVLAVSLGGAVGAAPAPPPQPLQLQWLDPAKVDARCMDGSRFGYYFRAATNTADGRKWVIELQGGGWCYNEGACYGRTLASYAGGVFGSSLNWTSTMGGYFSDNQSWNRVLLRYCSGASFTGFRAQGWDAGGWPVPGHPGLRVPAGAKLWFRGAANVADTITALQRDHGMAAGVDELVVTGSSAGGLATILNIDRIGLLTGASRVTGLADAGFFKYHHNVSLPGYHSSANFSANMHYVYDMVNASGVLGSQCLAAQGAAAGAPVPPVGGSERPAGGPWNCMMAATAIQYVRAPLFVLQSRFDHFQLGAIDGLDCMMRMPYVPPFPNATCSRADVASIAAYGADLRAEMERVVTAPATRRALFLSACVVHGQVGPPAWNRTIVAGATPQQAWRSWYHSLAAAIGTGSMPTRVGDAAARVGSPAQWIEECELPCNTNKDACAPFEPSFGCVEY